MDNLNKQLSDEAQGQPSCLGAVSRSPIYGIFRFDDKGYVGYWTDYETGKKVFDEEYDNGEWYYDEMVCQDCG